MRSHTDWSANGFGLPPLAAGLSVFPSRAFLEPWSSVLGLGSVELVEDDRALLPMWRQMDGVVAFLGDADLTDYHSPLGRQSPEVLRAYLDAQPAGTTYRFDSLPKEVCDSLLRALPERARGVQHEAAYRLRVGHDFDEFLGGLPKRERHEFRRKRRRFTEVLGQPRLLVEHDPVDVFVSMHRRADGEKGAFMTPAREEFFRRLAQLPETRVHIAGGRDGTPVAASFGFVDDATYYLYNSAYEPQAATLSPGMALLWLIFEEVAGSPRSRVDFLKGDEPYKLRLGARPRPLFVLEGST